MPSELGVAKGFGFLALKDNIVFVGANSELPFGTVYLYNLADGLNP